MSCRAAASTMRPSGSAGEAVDAKQTARSETAASARARIVNASRDIKKSTYRNPRRSGENPKTMIIQSPSGDCKQLSHPGFRPFRASDWRDNLHPDRSDFGPTESDPMSRWLAVPALGLALCAIEPLRIATVHAAGQAAGTKPAAALPQGAASAAMPNRALLDQYCVTCHSDRLKTGGLTLEKVDVGDAQGNAEVLEKIVRKLRTGQMPP